MTHLSKIEQSLTNATKSFISAIEQQYDFAGAILFGSRARNTHHADSDADIAVILNGTHGKFVDVKLAMSDIAYDVLLETGIRIQPLPIWQDEWEHPETYSNPRLLENIVREGVRL